MRDQSQYFPVALERDVRPRSLVRTRLLGVGIVLWRSDDDTIQVWEDRCPHRSVRLSAGRNLGDCIEGVYHGWRFGKDGSVIAVPAEGYAPRSDIKVRSLAKAIRAGMIWAALEDGGASPPDHEPTRSEVLIRPLPIRAPLEIVGPALRDIDGARLIATPMDRATCFVFGHASPVGKETAIETARRFNDRLTERRRAIETRAVQ